MKLLPLLVSLLLGDSVVIPGPCSWNGTCSTTLTAPDFCTISGNCLSDAGGSSSGITNPYTGTLVVKGPIAMDGGSINGSPIATQILTGWDGGSIAGLAPGLGFFCEAGTSFHTGAGSYSVEMVKNFQTHWCFCGCETNAAPAASNQCAATCVYGNDGGTGGIVNIFQANTSSTNLWWCCGL